MWDHLSSNNQPLRPRGSLEHCVSRICLSLAHSLHFTGEETEAQHSFFWQSPLATIGTQVCLPREGRGGPGWCPWSGNTEVRVGLTKPVVQRRIFGERTTPRPLVLRSRTQALPSCAHSPQRRCSKGNGICSDYSLGGTQAQKAAGAWQANSSPSPPKCPWPSGFIPAWPEGDDICFLQGPQLEDSEAGAEKGASLWNPLPGVRGDQSSESQNDM